MGRRTTAAIHTLSVAPLKIIFSAHEQVHAQPFHDALM
jgi:hypothetical protein